MKYVLVLVVGLAFVSTAAEIFFQPAPTLLDVFQVVVRGVEEERGEAIILNLATGELKKIELQREKETGLLKSKSLQAVRQCDVPSKEVEAIRVRGVGDVLVAATELGVGLAVAQKVGPRTGELSLRLEKRVGEQWEKVQTLASGAYRLVINAPQYDETCALDLLPGELTISIGKETKAVEIEESAPTSGKFLFYFEGKFQLDREKGELLYRLSWRGKASEDEVVVLAPSTMVVFQAVEQEIRALVKTLVAEVGPAPVIYVPVGCRAQVRLIAPKEPDEVWWHVFSRWYKGESLELEADAPSFPAALLARVFARKAADWGMTQIALTVVERPTLSFVTPEGKPITPPWPKDQPFRVRVCGVFEFAVETITVRVGKLGPHPMAREVRLKHMAEGCYESENLLPADWAAESGDVLWIELCYPAPITCCFSTILPLR